MPTATASLASSTTVAVVLTALTKHVLSSVITGSADVPAMFVFGDSLADVGNNNDIPVAAKYKANFPYSGIDFPGGEATGRFSNGYNAVDFLAKKMGFDSSPHAYMSVTSLEQLLNGCNFASGGSGILDATGPGTISLKIQIANFLSVKLRIGQLIGVGEMQDYLARSLFVICTGNNDLFEYYSDPDSGNSTAGADLFLSNLADEFERRINDLYDLGARKFWIPSVGKIGCVPYFRRMSPSGDCIEELNSLARRFNAAMKARLLLLSSRRMPEALRYSFTDSIAIMSAITAAPKQYGLIELKTACCGAGRFNGAAQCTVSAALCMNRDDYAFWDWYHPTEAVHRLAAELAYLGSARLFAHPMNVKQLVETQSTFSE